MISYPVIRRIYFGFLEASISHILYTPSRLYGLNCITVSSGARHFFMEQIVNTPPMAHPSIKLLTPNKSSPRNIYNAKIQSRTHVGLLW